MKPVRDAGPMALFGARLRLLRQQHGLTQMAVAEQLCVDRTTYNKYEAGKVSPDHQGLLKLAAMFNVTVDHLLGRESAVTLAVAEGDGAVMVSEQEKLLLQLFRQLPSEEKDRVVEQVQIAFRNR